MSGSEMTAPSRQETGDGLMPGDPAPRQLVERIVRVDQAGEYGAVRIYQGQRAVLGRSPSCGEALRKMEDEERRHLNVFNEMVGRRRVRPTLLQPLWHVVGFALGAATALLGEKAAMACTVAVEEVIEGHYAGQLEQLGDDEADLKQTVAEFRADELHHRDVGLAGGAERAPAYPLLSAAIKSGARLAIWLSERV
jgi:ubiquinone biosynthesis monooxygenase Coq7